jgi:hypothetical protein
MLSSAQHHAHNRQPVRLRAQCKGFVVSSHHEIDVSHFFPKQSCSEVNGIEGTEFGGHWLRCSIEDSCFDVYHLK